ncbi:MAG: hypothetical protein LBI58_04860 [Tannerellaceae bacterium]|jgi:hypothetical protein|nr:hypothetical protein [Tannerellaceae bacterium]
MYTANPNYDAVLEFLFADEEVARVFLSAITGENVLEVNFSAHKRVVRSANVQISNPRDRSKHEEVFPYVCRLDFTARIALAGGGFKTVTVELQKARYAIEIMYFRRYYRLACLPPAGETYSLSGDEDVYSIFIIEGGAGLTGAKVVAVDYSSFGRGAGDFVCYENEFVKMLENRSWIVQMDQLGSQKRNDLEKLLALFDQDNVIGDHRIMHIDDEDFPSLYRVIMERLSIGIGCKDLQSLVAEDDYNIDDPKERLKITIAINKIAAGRSISLAERIGDLAGNFRAIAESCLESGESDETLKKWSMEIAEKTWTISGIAAELGEQAAEPGDKNTFIIKQTAAVNGLMREVAELDAMFTHNN